MVQLQPCTSHTPASVMVEEGQHTWGWGRRRSLEGGGRQNTWGGKGGDRGWRRQGGHYLGEEEQTEHHQGGGEGGGFLVWATVPGRGWGGAGRRRQSIACWSSSPAMPVREELTDQHPGRTTKGSSRLGIKHS